MRNLIAAAAALALATFAATAADTSVYVNGRAPNLNGGTLQRRIAIQYGDLNPNDKQGAAALLERIAKAGEAVCTLEQARGSKLVAKKIEKCRAEAVAQAVEDVGAPELVAAAGGK
jgi:UrcA family protein